jgi:hypothetical protein
MRQTGLVPTEKKFETVDGYAMIDLDGATRCVGPIRSAKRVLQRTTIDLVRHATYALAIHEIDASGAAAALNHDRASNDQSPIAAFSVELTSWAESAGFSGHVGMGLDPDEIGPALHPTALWRHELEAASARGAMPPVYSIVVVSDQDESVLTAPFMIPTVDVEPNLEAALTSGADAVFVRGKTGVLNHEVLAETNVGHIIGLQPLTTTARGLAIASARGCVIVPDFLSASGPYVAAASDIKNRSDLVKEVEAQTRAAAARLTDEGPNSFVRACELAEEHILTWAPELPFGRPLAP